MTGVWGRYRQTIASQLTVVVVALVVLLAVGGYLAYTGHVAPGTEMETQQVTSWAAMGSFSHQATVTNGTEAFEEGTVLRNRSVYFTRVSPAMEGQFTYRYRASDGGSVDVQTTLLLVIRSVSEGEGQGRTVYWQADRRLAQDRTTGLAPGESTTTDFAVNMSAVQERAERISDQQGATIGEREVAIVARTGITGTRNGAPVNATRQYELPVGIESGLYRVATDAGRTDEGGETRRVNVPADRGPLWEVIGPILGLLGLAGLAVVAQGHRTGAFTVSERERDWLAYKRARSEYGDWITTGRVPASARSDVVVAVDTLEGLVDVAIDTDNRVIEDESRGACLVLGADCWYRYEIPPEPAEAESAGRLDPQAKQGDGEGSDGEP